MFDYNTHKDFGSGDRICYHGVMDMFRNPKLAAAVYAAQADESPVLEISSQMDIGEHPSGNMGKVFLITNADSVRMYRGDRLIREYRPAESPFTNLRRGPILIDDYIGDRLRECCERAERLLTEHRAQLDALAEELLQKGLLLAPDVRRVLGEIAV